jgi:hypothetical protein
LKTSFLHSSFTNSLVQETHPLVAIDELPSQGASASNDASSRPESALAPTAVVTDTTASRLFYDRWAPQKSAVASIEELNEVTSLLTTYWHKRTSAGDESRGKQNIKPHPP